MENLASEQQSYVVVFRTELTDAEAINAVGGLADLRVIILHRPTQLLAAMLEKDFAHFAGLSSIPDPPSSEPNRMAEFAKERERMRRDG